MPRPLLTPIFEGATRSTHFFEGRLLSARDLRDEQQAGRERNQRLARAIGAGVVQGLDVRIDNAGSPGVDPVLTVSAGLAIAREGQVLELSAAEQIVLARAPVAPAAEGRTFSDCRDDPPQTVHTGNGLYVLLMSPVAAYQERAPRSGLGAPAPGRVTGCGTRYKTHGVQFRVEPLNLTGFADLPAPLQTELQQIAASTESVAVSRLRNVAAHACFGTLERGVLTADPFLRELGASTLSEYGALDALASAGAMTGCEVPLALLSWTSRGVGFVDRWAARRNVAPPATSVDWTPALGSRERAEAEAQFLQFQDHVDWLARLPDPRRRVVEARAHFRLLPPAGIIPLDDGASSRGFDIATFFRRVKVRRDQAGNPQPAYMDGAKLQAVLRQSLAFAAIDLETEEHVWLYYVRQNRDGSRRPDGGARQAALVFASGFMPFAADAQFDLARWNFSNYGAGVAAWRIAGRVTWPNH